MFTTEIKNGYVYYGCYNHTEYARLLWLLGKNNVPFEKLDIHKAGHLYQVKVEDFVAPAVYAKQVEEESTKLVEESVADFTPDKLESMTVNEIKSVAATLGIDLDERVRTKSRIIEDFIKAYQKNEMPE